MNSRAFFVFIGLAVTANAAAAQDAQARRKVVDGYGKLPLAFEANGGQAPEQVKFLARGPGYEVFLTGNEAVLALSKSAGGAGAALHMKLAGANPAPVTGEDALPGKSNYFIGNDPRKWRSNLPNYGKVRYHGVYAGVDLIYYGNPGQLEYDFVVAPGADLRKIRLSFGGASAVRVDHTTGDLLLKTAFGAVRFREPAIYQPATDHDSRTAVEGSYRLGRHNQVTFNVGPYDHRRALVIDPALAYSTYLGGSNGDIPFGTAVDASGSVYVTGWTESSNFPTTAGAFQAQCPPGCSSGGGVVFVSKLNPDGSAGNK
jgi:hypothetical protein